MIALGPAPEITVVTGAAGWLGTALMHALTQQDSGWYRPGMVRALVTNRLEAEQLRALSDGVDAVIGDITDASSLTALTDDTDHATVDVIHTAGVIHPRRLADFDAVNHRGTRNVLELAARSHVRRFVHVSSNSPFGTNPHGRDRFRNEEPYHPYYGYGRSKLAAELAVLEAVDAGLDAVIVRPPWFYGPHQPPRQTTFFQLVRAGRFPVIGDGQQMRSMAYVDNLVQGIVRAELVPTPAGRGWWIADARPYSVTEIVETVGRALRDEGLEVRSNTLHVPAIVGRLAELADAVIQRTGRYVQQVHVLGEMDKHIACDVSVAGTELGYRPEVELYDGMRRSIRWCLDRGMAL